MDLSLLSLAITALAGTELLFALGESAYGILASLASVTILYLVISFAKVGSTSKEVIEVICLLLTYVLLISSLPWFFLSQDLLLPAVYFILIVLCLLYVRNARVGLERLGLRSASVKVAVPCCVLGVATGAIEYEILRPAPAVPAFSAGYFLQTALYMVVFVGLGEELLFRGILLTSLEKLMSPRWALVVHSAVFAILHFTWRSVPEVVFVFFAGMILGWVFQRTKSLLPSIIIHAANNVKLVAVLPFL